MLSATPELEYLNFPQPYATKTLAAGSSATIFEMIISGGYTGFIEDVWILWRSDTWLEWIVDGVPATGESRIEHDIGSLDSPKKYNPPIIARNFIRVIAHNDASASKTFEVLIDGVLSKPKTY